MLLPINYAVLDIVNVSTKDGIEQPSVPQRPLCGVCGTNTASVYCVHCLPGSLFNFCEKCDRDEHMRNFGPARRHNRFPIDDAPPNDSTFCSRHPVAATMYSDVLAEFACHVCQQEEDWQSRSGHFEPVDGATKKLMERVKQLNKYCSDMLWKLGMSKQNLETIENDLEPSAMTVKTQVTETFSRCVEVLQERQRTLLANVDVEVSE
jgi:hypothetical protein